MIQRTSFGKPLFLLSSELRQLSSLTARSEFYINRYKLNFKQNSNNNNNDTCTLNPSPLFGEYARPQGTQCDYCCLSQGLCDEIAPSGYCPDPPESTSGVGQERWIDQLRQDNILQTSNLATCHFLGR